jgi:hypothetical protein
MFQTLFKNLKSIEIKIFIAFNIEQQFLFMVQIWYNIRSFLLILVIPISY